MVEPPALLDERHPKGPQHFHEAGVCLGVKLENILESKQRAIRT